MKKPRIFNITCIDAVDFPSEIEDYCMDNDISTHYRNDIVLVEDDGNILAEWLKKHGYKFKDKDGDWVGIIAT